MKNSLNTQRLEVMLEALGELAKEMVFTGGAVVELYLDKTPSHPPRPTKDVDCIVAATSRMEYQKLEEQLHKRGFVNAGLTERNAPLCRYKYQDILLDVMPSSQAALGFTNPWFENALENPIERMLPSGIQIRLASLPCFLAIKIETMNSRGGDDLRVSQDLEDIITLIDGSRDAPSSVRKSVAPVRDFVTKSVSELLQRESFREAVDACSPGGFDQAERVLSSMEKIARVKSKNLGLSR